MGIGGASSDDFCSPSETGTQDVDGLREDQERSEVWRREPCACFWGLFSSQDRKPEQDKMAAAVAPALCQRSSWKKVEELWGLVTVNHGTSTCME